MRLTRRSALLLTKVSWLAVLMCLNACYSWRATQLTPSYRFRKGDQVRVERSNQRATVLVDPEIHGDTLIGHKNNGSDRRIAIMLADVRRAETLRFNGRQTAVSVGVVVGSIGGLIGLALANLSSSIDWRVP